MPTDHTTTFVEFFWVFQRKALLDDLHLHHALQTLDAAPGAQWARNDLNNMGMWKPYRAVTAAVDAQTQRTALMRFEGLDGTLGVLALGKHGEPPTLVVRARVGDVESALSYALAGANSGALRAFGAVPVAARDAYLASGRGLHRLGEFDLVTWITGAADPSDEQCARLAGAGVARAQGTETACFMVLPTFALAVDEALRRWTELAETLTGLPVV